MLCTRVRTLNSLLSKTPRRLFSNRPETSSIKESEKLTTELDNMKQSLIELRTDYNKLHTEFTEFTKKYTQITTLEIEKDSVFNVDENGVDINKLNSESFKSYLQYRQFNNVLLVLFCAFACFGYYKILIAK